MKISKVDHNSFCIPLDEIYEQDDFLSEPQGLLYNLLDGKFSGEDYSEALKKVVSDRIDNSMKLYSVFNSKSSMRVDKATEKRIASLIEFFNRTMKWILGKPGKDQPQISYQIENLVNSYSNSTNKKIFDKIPDAEIETMADMIALHCLRASLRRRKFCVPDAVNDADSEDSKQGEPVVLYDSIHTVKYLLCALACKDYRSYSEQLPNEELVWFLRILNEDYRKAEDRETIPDSIEKKVTKIKLVESAGERILVPSTWNHKKKQFLFAFMQRYCKADEAGRNSELAHIRCLILLYICGEDVYRKAINGTDGPVYATGFGTYIPGEQDSFCPMAVSINDQILELQDQIKEIANKKANKEQCFDNRSELKEKIYQLSIERKNALESAVTRRYQAAVKVLYDGKTKQTDSNGDKVWTEDEYWLDYIRSCAKVLILEAKHFSETKLLNRFLAEKIFKTWKSYIATRFIDYGKAVYHFTGPDKADLKDPNGVTIGEILPQYKNGLSTFDYERIVAEDNLKRESQTYIAFAVNAFTRSACDDDQREKDDVLLSSSKITPYKDIDRRILQFFGGKSTWKKSELSDPTGQPFTAEDYFKAICNPMFALRNNAFHYRAVFSVDDSKGIIHALADGESKRLGSIYRKKYFSTNTVMFYSEYNINQMMGRLYNGSKHIPAQIPSFKHVIPRGQFINFISGEDHLEKWSVDKDSLERIISSDIKDLEKQYLSALYFMLKEIYYYDFLQSGSAKDYFYKALGSIKHDESDKKKLQNAITFGKRVYALRADHSLGEICQIITTEFMLQNKDQKLTDDSTNKNQQEAKIYEFYMQLLYKCMREGFLKYLKNATYIKEEKDGTTVEKKVWGFLRFPSIISKVPSEEKFCGKWTVSLYDGIVEKIDEDEWLKAWYICGHFMPQKYLTHMIGRVRYYIQYMQNIDRRAVLVGDKASSETAEKVAWAEDWCRTLEFTKNFCGNVTNVVSDYFGTENAPFKPEDGTLQDHIAEYDPEMIEARKRYAKELFKFVDFSSDSEHRDTDLIAFCDTEDENSPDGKIRIYHDPKNPIVNRNVVRSMMFGTTSILAGCTQKVTESEIHELYKAAKELAPVFKDGCCRSKDQLIKYKHYQNLKNRIELVDLSMYTEVLNDLFAHLISWCYFRERDKMYLQLGFHYCRLKFAAGEVETFCRAFDSDTVYGKGADKLSEVHIKDGTILYNIAAMYDYGLPIVSENQTKGNRAEASKAGVANKQKSEWFINWYCHGDNTLYQSGLEFFENQAEAEDISRLRNDIDHFNYFNRMNRSMLKYYSEVYDRILSYDPNYRKSVSYVLPNTLMRYFVKAQFDMAQTTKEIKDLKPVKTGQLVLRRSALKSGVFSYKVKGQSKPEIVNAREQRFLDEVADLLDYQNLNS